MCPRAFRVSENDVRIILGSHVNNYHLEHPGYRSLKRFCTNLKQFWVRAEPVPCLQLEVLMCLYDQGVLVVVPLPIRCAWHA